MYSQQCYASEKPRGNFITSGTNLPLDSNQFFQHSMSNVNMYCMLHWDVKLNYKKL